MHFQKKLKKEEMVQFEKFKIFSQNKFMQLRKLLQVFNNFVLFFNY